MTALRMWMVPAVVAAAAALLLRPSAAQEAKAPAPGAETGKAAQAGDVELLTTAYRLADFAKDTKSPEAYITAAGLVLRLNEATKAKGGLAELDITPEVQDDKGNPVKGAKVETAKAESLEDMADGWFASASSLGKDLGISREVEALVKAAKARSHVAAGAGDKKGRGARGGPRTRAVSIAPHATHAFHITFDSQAIAAIGFRASGTLRVQMRTGNSLVFDQTTSIGNYSWVPPGTRGQAAAFTIRNPHGHSVQYQLFTN